MSTIVQACHSLSARIETEEQIKNHRKAHFRGYTVAEGDRDAAERAYEAHVGSKQSESADPSSQGDANKK